MSDSCPGWLKIKRVCGCEQVIAVPCRDPLCVPCQKLIAYQHRERWWPVVEAMRHPKHITLTIKSGFDLAERVGVLTVAFDRFLDVRLGPRNWPKYRELAKEWWADHLAENEPNEMLRAHRSDAMAASLDQFGRDIRGWYRRNGRWPRLRDVVGKGFSTLEVTYNHVHGWHVHRHLVTDSLYIPHPLLVVLWHQSNRGEGYIVGIKSGGRDRKSMRELLKYVTKPWEIPLDKADELREVLYGRKRVWPLGGARPVCHEAQCPGCGKPTSECRAIDIGFADTVSYDGRDQAVIRLRRSGEELAIHRVDGRWTVLNSIPMRFACHSEPIRAGPDPPGQCVEV